MTNKISNVISAAAESFEKVDNTIMGGRDKNECNFGDCKGADCCFNICRSLVINICKLDID